MAVGKREEMQDNMKVNRVDISAELETLALDMIENISYLEKLRPLLENCSVELDSSLDGVDPVSMFSASVKNLLRKVIEDARKDIKVADKFLLLYKIRRETVKMVNKQ